jgi:predicted DNA-binding helix-hairpin-helix protein
MEEGTMGKVIKMRVHILSQEKKNQEIKEEVDTVDRANNSQSVETTKKKGSQEIEVGRNSKDFVDIVGCKGTKHQIALQETKNVHGKWKQRREHEEQLFQLWDAWSLQQKLP